MSFSNSELLLAQIDWKPLWQDHGIPLAIMGLAVVFAALILLRVFIGTLPRIMAIIDKFLPEHPEVAAVAATASDAAIVSDDEATPTDDLPEEILVVIAAAVAATVGQPHRIVRMSDASSQNLSWSSEGRRQHHASHGIQPRDSR